MKRGALIISDNIFRAYDIRGIAGREFDSDGAEIIGKAYGTYILEKNKDAKKIVVGYDGRVTSPGLSKTFINGILATGLDVINIGQTTTPMLYFSIFEGDFDGGVMITASHNPKEYNGFKMCSKNAHSISGAEIQKIGKLVRRKRFARAKDRGVEKGEELERSYLSEYSKKIASLVDLNIDLENPPKIVVDAGNGIAGKFAPEILKGLGIEVVELFCEVDGIFPNHEPNPDNPEALSELSEKVITEEADFGIAFDGDGDRLGMVDEKGRFVTADNILLLLTRDLLKRKKKAPIVFDVKISQVLINEVKKLKGVPVMSKTGHSFIEEKMREVKSILGGEASGHFFFGEDYYGFDDAMLAALKIIGIYANSKAEKFSYMFLDLPKTFSTPELRIPCRDEDKFKVVEQVVEFFKDKHKCITIDGIRMDFGDGAWGAVRASNTSPNITARFEAKTPEKVEEIKEIVFTHLRKYPELKR